MNANFIQRACSSIVNNQQKHVFAAVCDETKLCNDNYRAVCPLGILRTADVVSNALKDGYSLSV